MLAAALSKGGLKLKVLTAGRNRLENKGFIALSQ